MDITSKHRPLGTKDSLSGGAPLKPRMKGWILYARTAVFPHRPPARRAAWNHRDVPCPNQPRPKGGAP